MLCDNQWVNIDWSGAAFRTNSQNINMTFSRAATTIMPFEKACDQVAEMIYAEHKNIYLELSGGCDSENIANTFIRLKIPFTPVLLTYDFCQYNEHRLEAWYATHWCKQNNITPLTVDIGTYINSQLEKSRFIKIRPRLFRGLITKSLLLDEIEKRGGQMINGSQLEYYPDHEQMEYLRPTLENYQGFVLQEADYYEEMLSPNQHPWAFHYWTPEVLASFVYHWDETLTMQENKAQIYKVNARPKFSYAHDIVDQETIYKRGMLTSKFGTQDVATLGSKKELLSKLIG